jgi:hypothetical protein
MYFQKLIEYFVKRRNFVVEKVKFCATLSESVFPRQGI